MSLESSKSSKNQNSHPNKIYFCDKCNYKCRYLSDWNAHISTRKHNFFGMPQKSQKVATKKTECLEDPEEYKKTYECVYCNYYCSKKYNFEKHLQTAKHKRKNQSDNIVEIKEKEVIKIGRAHV